MTVAAFLRELHILRLCGTHPNVIKFYGALTCNSARPQVILELCPKGDLFRLIRLEVEPAMKNISFYHGVFFTILY